RVRRGGTLRSVNWHRTWKGLLRARSMEHGAGGWGLGAGGWGLAAIGCHPERSEGSVLQCVKQIPRHARDDKNDTSLPRSQTPAPSPSRLHEPQRHPIALADRLVLRIVRVVVVVARWQRPHAVGVVPGVLRIGVGFARRVEG